MGGYGLVEFKKRRRRWRTGVMSTRAFEVMAKRRKSYPSETRVGRGRRFVHGEVELQERLGRRDLCPCGSGRRFQGMLPALWTI